MVQQQPFDRIAYNPIDPNQIQINPQMISTSQQMQQYVPIVAVHCANEIQVKSSQTALRVYYFNTVASQGFQGQDFYQLVASVCDYAFYVLAQGNVNALQQVIPQAVSEVTTMMVSAALTNNPGLQQAVGGQVIQAANAEIQKLTNMAQLIQAAKQGGMMMGGQQIMQTTTMMQPQQQQPMMMQPQQTQTVMSNMAPSMAVTHAAPAHVPATNLQIVPSPLNGSTTMGTQTETNMYLDDDDEEDEIVSWGGAPQQQPTIQTVAPAAAIAPVAAVEEVAVDSSGAFQLSEGDEVQAVNSNWKWTWNIANPYPYLYQPSTHALMHVCEGGRTFEQIVNKESIVDLNEQALELSFQREAYPNPTGNADWKTIREVAVVTEGVVDLDIGTIPVLPEWLIESNIQLSHYMAIEVARDSGYALDVTKPYIHYTRTVDTICGSRFTGELDTKAFVEALSGGTLRELYRLLQDNVEGNGKPTFELTPRMWRIIEERARDYTTKALRIGLSVGWTLDSFMEDYPTLKVELRDAYGDGMVEQFEKNEADIVASIIACVTMNDYLDIKAAEDAIAFTSQCAVLNVPWSSGELDIQLSDDGPSLISRTKSPALQAAMKAYVSGTDVATHRYILTTDKVLLEVGAGWLAEDCYLIFWPW